MVPDDEHQFRCSVCSLNASCDNGVSNVLRHAEKSEQFQNCQKLGLFDVFKKYTIDNQIPFSNILSISCDNTAVMVGNIISFKTLIRKQNPSILFIPCICHKLALVTKDYILRTY